MNKERTKVGAIEISERIGKPIICIEVKYNAKGDEDSTWVSYEKELLKTRMGMSPESHQLYSLQHFVDVLDANQPIRQISDTIKIRYAYLTSLTNLKEDPFYRETLTFRTLSVSELEASHGSLKDLLTLNTTTLIKILGRDLYTGRVDMNGKAIYEGDIIRWFLDSGNYFNETINSHSHFSELLSEEDSKVIGTIYDKRGDI